jgi:hypothetical protein
VTDANLARILRPAEAVLFDFDGPVCSVFDGYPAQQITEELRKLARDVRGDLSPALIGASSRMISYSLLPVTVTSLGCWKMLCRRRR